VFIACFGYHLICHLFSLRKQSTFREVATWALAKRRLSNERRNSKLMTCTTQIFVVLLIGWKKIPSRHNQSEAIPRSEYCTSSVRNFCARYSDVVLQGLWWRPRETLAAYSGYHLFYFLVFHSELGTPHFLNTRNVTNTQDKYNFFGVIDIVHLITSHGLGSFNAKKTDKTKVLPECSESQNAVSFAE